MAHHSLAPQAVTTQPTLVLSWELTFRAWVLVSSPCPSKSGCSVQGQLYQRYVWLSLCFVLLIVAAVLFSRALRSLLSLVLIYLSVRWPPRFIYSFTVPSQDCWSCLNSFLFLIFSLSQLCGGFLALCGDLRSSSSIQQIFCSNHSTCKCFFFFWYVCGRRWKPHLTPLISWSLLLFVVFFFLFFIRTL